MKGFLVDSTGASLGPVSAAISEDLVRARSNFNSLALGLSLGSSAVQTSYKCTNFSYLGSKGGSTGFSPRITFCTISPEFSQSSYGVFKVSN